MNDVKLENADKGLCVICDKPTEEFAPFKNKMTCSEDCHEKFVKFCEEQFGTTKKVVDSTTDITYRVPTREIVENGLKWEELPKYPRWEENEHK